jgi:hypothetical protein
LHEIARVALALKDNCIWVNEPQWCISAPYGFSK